MQLLLCLVDRFLVVSRNVNLVFTSSMRSRRGVAIDSRERRWKVDGSVCGGFDHSDILARSAADDGM